MIDMKQAIYLSTNGNDIVLVADGSFLTVDKDVMKDFFSAEPVFSNWHGTDSWASFAGTMDEAAEVLASEGAEVLAYAEGDAITFVDEEAMKERREFYLPNLIWIDELTIIERDGLNDHKFYSVKLGDNMFYKTYEEEAIKVTNDIEFASRIASKEFAEGVVGFIQKFYDRNGLRKLGN